MSTIERGGALFISFEGCDGCGKSTQLSLLAGRLRETGREVVCTVEPGGTRIGGQIRQILLDPANQEMSPPAELLLYFAARAQNTEEIIRPALQRGAIVLTDRFTDSTVAYQGAARGSGREAVEALHEIACSGLWPQLTILLDVDLASALDRAEERNRRNAERNRMDEQSREFYGKVQAEYRRIAAREPGRVRIVDGAGGIEQVAARVWDVVSPLLH